MRKTSTWMFVCLLSLAAGAWHLPHAGFPVAPPNQPQVPVESEKVIRLNVEYDEAFAKQHGDRLEEFVREAIAIHNIEWRRYRREWFVLGDLRFHPSGSERDASYVLANFLHRSIEAPATIHVNIVGRQLEVYKSGTRATPIGGLAYRGSDALVISATRGVTADWLAYYLFHELGHCWDAYDVPFGGGETTYGSKTRMTFDVDAGNEEIMQDARGPHPRGASNRAPMIIREKLARARAVARDTHVYPQLHDLLMHEPSPANPAYVAKKRKLLAMSGPHRAVVMQVLRRYEPTRQHLRDDAAVRQTIAEHYWRANDAIRREDYAAAHQELQAIRATAAATPDVHLLLGAVEKKVRRRR